MKIKYLTLFFTVLFHALAFTDYNGFDDNPLISENYKPAIRNFLLPEDHPMKESMDRLFQNRAVIKNGKNFERAGFQTLFLQKRSKIRVARHKLLPGYLVKVVLDDELEFKKGIPEWYWFLQRCIGAKKIRDSIETHGFTKFTVPGKWIYPLTWWNAPDSFYYLPKSVVLLVEDMNLMGHADSQIAWNVKITKEHLDELYVILSESGGASYRTDNIPYSYDGTFSFIDTEYPEVAADLTRIKKHLSKDMAAYWQLLIDTGGKGLPILEAIHIQNSESLVIPLYF